MIINFDENFVLINIRTNNNNNKKKFYTNNSIK